MTWLIIPVALWTAWRSWHEAVDSPLTIQLGVLTFILLLIDAVMGLIDPKRVLHILFYVFTTSWSLFWLFYWAMKL